MTAQPPPVLPVLPAADRERLRDMARRVRDLAHAPANLERRGAWIALREGRPSRPMVLAEDGGVRDRRPPFAHEPRCGGEEARALERQLAHRLWWPSGIGDDSVETPFLDMAWRVDLGHYGAHAVTRHGDNAGHLGAYAWEPPVTDLRAQLDTLQPCRMSVDRGGTLARRAWLDEAVGDILPTRLRGLPFWTLGLTMETIFLIGLEPLMLLMHDDPGSLHRLLEFQCAQWERRLDWLEAEGLLGHNNENDYVGSGSRGWLPPGGGSDGQAPRWGDLWALSESQETVGVGPAFFAEFIFPYQRRLTARFGWLYYGCCEPVHARWETLRKFPNLKAVSVAPWADEEFMAGACAGAGVTYSRKPNPTLVSTARFDEDAIRADVARTVRLAARAGAGLEIVMKDVHTLHEEPGRLRRWVELARGECGC